MGVVEKLVEHVAKNKFSPISPYLFHLYHHSKVQDSTEVVSYDIGIAILKYGLTDEIEKEFEEEEEAQKEKHNLIDPQERQRKSTDSASQGKLLAPKEGEPNQIPP